MLAGLLGHMIAVNFLLVSVARFMTLLDILCRALLLVLGHIHGDVEGVALEQGNIKNSLSG